MVFLKIPGPYLYIRAMYMQHLPLFTHPCWRLTGYMYVVFPEKKNLHFVNIWLAKRFNNSKWFLKYFCSGFKVLYMV